MSDEPRWAQIQKRTFTAWCNQHLKDRVLGIKDLYKDFESGVLLINLVEILTKNLDIAPKYVKNPTIRAQQIENNSKVLAFLKRRGIKLVGIGAEDIVDGKSKLILGMIWTLILRYHIQKGGGDAKSELLAWVRKQIPECDVKNFTNSWTDGKAICHLTNSLSQGCIELGTLGNMTPLKRAVLGENVAEKELDIPMILAPEDLVSDEPDELSTMTYISYFRDYFDDMANRSVKKKLPDPAKCLILHEGDGDKGEQFIPVKLKVQSRNYAGNNLDHGGDGFAASVAFYEKDTPLPEHEGSGGKIANAPSSGNLNEAHTDSKQLQKTTSFKNVKSSALPEVAPTGGKHVDCELKDNGDGTYPIRFTPLDIGNYLVHVTYNQIPISNSPLVVPVSKSSITADGDGLKHPKLFIPAPIVISAKKLHSSGVKLAPSDFDVVVTGPKGKIEDISSKDNNDGTYTYEYIPNNVGRYNVKLAYVNRAIAESPYGPTVEPLSLPISGAGAKKAEQFIPAKFTVDATAFKDKGAPLSADDLKPHLVNPAGKPVDIAVKDNRDGTFDVEYVPLEAGNHQLNLSAKGQPVSGTPLTIPVDKSSITAYGDGLSKADVLKRAEFTIAAKKLKEQGVRLSTSDFPVLIKDINGFETDADVKDNGDGTFLVGYTPKEEGKYKINLSYKGHTIAESPYTVNVQQLVLKAFGAGLTEAEQFVPTTFFIDGRKLLENGIPVKSSDLDVALDSSKEGKLPSELKDQGDGTFAVTFTPTEPGKVSAAASYKGKPIENSPFSIPVQKSSISASGPGLEGGEVLLPSHFQIQAKKLAESGVPLSKTDFDIQVTNPKDQKQPVDVTDAGNGTFDVKFTPTDVGKFGINLAYKGKPIAKSPYNPTVKSSSVTATGPGVGEGPFEQNVPTEFTLNAKKLADAGVPLTPADISVKFDDGKGNPIQLLPAENASDPKNNIVDKGDGTFLVTYAPTEPGRGKLDVRVKGQPVQNAPFTINVDKPITDPSKCVAYGPGLEPGNVIEKETQFTIESRNKLGEPIKAKTGDNFKVKIYGPPNPVGNTSAPLEIEPKIVDNNNGTQTVFYTPVLVGPHKIEVKLKDTPISGSPFEVLIGRDPDAADPSQFIAFGPGLEGGNTSEYADFTVQAVNGRGEKMTKGGAKLAVNVERIKNTSKVSDVKLVDNDNGTYAVSYLAKDPGDHKIEVLLKSNINPKVAEHIKNSPFTVPIQAGTDARMSQCFGKGLEEGLDTKPAKFKIQARDRDGNNIPHGGDPFEVKIKSDQPGVVVPLKLVDNGDGTYDVEYSPVNAGWHDVDVLLRGKPVGGGPYHVNIKKGTDPRLSIVEKYEFIIRAKTKDGQNQTTGGDKVEVTVIGPSGPLPADQVEVVDKHNGKYHVGYSVEGTGEYRIHVKIDGVHIKGSPWKQTHYNEAEDH